MKKISLFMSMVLLFLSVFSASALAAGTKPEDFPEYFDAKEYPEIEQALLEWPTGSTSIVSAYRLYQYANVSTVRFIDDLAEGKDISKQIKNKYGWVAVSEAGSAFTIVKDSGKWRVATQRNSSSTTKPSQDISREAFEKALDGIEATSVKAFQVSQIFTTFLLIQTKETTYVVPFCARPDFTYLDNGKRYTLEEAGTILRISDYYRNPPEGSVQIPAWCFIAGGAFLALIIAAVIIIILKKRKK